MIINTESTIGYHNKLKQAVAGMKLGVNNEVNPGTKKAAFKLIGGGPSKTNPPNSHPSKPIHKAATAAQTGRPQPGKPQKEEPTAGSTRRANAQTTEPTAGTSQHEINKTAVILGVVGLAALILIASH